MADRWQRDPGVSDMIDYFDQPENMDRGLRKKEQAAIKLEIQRCQESFEYAARNYFWIIDKRGMQIPLRLSESQELILDKINEMKAKHKAQKLMILKARQLGAVDPETRVLTADLRWRSIFDVSVGDDLIGVDEVTFGKGAGRKFRTAKILDKWEVQKPAYRVILSNGKELIASGDHPFLCKRRGSVWTEWRRVNDKQRKNSSSPIRPGDQIRFIVGPWSDSRSFEDGWFSGLLDGEGSCRAKPGAGLEINVSQVAGLVLEAAKRYLSLHNYSYRIEADKRKGGETSKFGDQPVYKLVVSRIPEVLEMLGTLRPMRLMGKNLWEGKELPSNGAAAWAEVVSVEPLGQRRLIDVRTTTGTFIAEGFVTHNCSTLIEALIAWRCMFHPQISALVVSTVQSHSAELFAKMLHIYDMLPWWLRPLNAARKYQEGIWFENPDPNDRRVNPGLNSRVTVQHSTQFSGIGQGSTIQAAHISEYTDWDERIAKECIEGDLAYSLPENEETFAVLESTGKGAGTYSERLWNANVELAERAEWTPLFLPWFFERSRTVHVLPEGWKPEASEIAMRERIEDEWLYCEKCGSWRERKVNGMHVDGESCPKCSQATLKPFVIDDKQLCYIQAKRINHQKKGDDVYKKLLQELATTAQDAWQLSGVCVYPEDCMNWVKECIRNPIAIGRLDQKGNFHGFNPKTRHCWQDWCEENHRYETSLPLKVWEWPEPGARYTIGVDPASGIGDVSQEADYSVAFVNRVGSGMLQDRQVAVFRSNTIDAYQFATPVVQLGFMYNTAMLTIEYNYSTTADAVRFAHQYPNLFRDKKYDSSGRLEKNAWHWVTRYETKPKLIGFSRGWLRSKSWIIRSENFYNEMRTFQADEDDDKRAGAIKGKHDDELLAGLMALFSSHDTDKERDPVYMPYSSERSDESFPWRMSCRHCTFEWGSDNPELERRCPKCGSKILSGKPRQNRAEVPHNSAFEEMANYKRGNNQFVNQYFGEW